MRALFLPLALGAVLALPGVADARKGNAPPGNSGIDEYVETILGPTGNRPTDRIRSRHHRSQLAPAVRRRLAAQGAAGEATARLAAATAPARHDARRLQDVAGGRATGGSRPLDAVTRAVSGQGPGGMGIALPAILIAALAVAIALVLLRRLRAT